MSKRVIIYQDGLLSYSETFIKKQALALTQWQPVLVGHKYIRSGLPLESLQAQLLFPEGASTLRRLLYQIYRWQNKADPIGLKTLKQLNAQLVHAHFGTSAVDIWPYVKQIGLPMLVTLHGFDISIKKEWWESGKRGRRKKAYPKRLLQLAQEPNVHFLAVSTAIKKRAVEFGIPEDKITISYIGVDTESFQPGNVPLTQRRNRILYIGRLVEKKGATYLLKAFAKVKAQVSDAELVIVGKGPLEPQLVRQIEELTIKDVRFTGALSSEEVKTEIDNAKIFCLPSITAENGDAEGLPISILEAQASGIFVVTSSSGGVGDNLIHDKTCFMFKEKDSEELASLLIRLLENSEPYLPVLRTQEKFIKEKFQLVDCAVKLEQVYDKYGKP